MSCFDLLAGVSCGERTVMTEKGNGEKETVTTRRNPFVSVVLALTVGTTLCFYLNGDTMTKIFGKTCVECSKKIRRMQ